MQLRHTLYLMWLDEPRYGSIKHECNDECISLRGKRGTLDVQTNEVIIDD